MPSVSIIIVNYNGDDLTTDCLKALEAQSFRNFNIIIVDNGSQDNSLHKTLVFLEKNSLHDSVKIIRLKDNTGFTGGNIEGLKHAEGDYIALLNNDTEPDRIWLDELVRAMEKDLSVGIGASRMIVHGTQTIDSAGDGFSTSLKGFKRGEGEAAASFDSEQFIFGGCAGAALYRRKMLDETGFLDKDFFLLFEDADLNFRAQLAGWKVLYIPSATVYHKVRSSIVPMSDTAVYYALRNAELVKIKNVPPGIILRFLPEIITAAILDFIYFALKYGRFRLYFKAKMDALRLLPKMMKKRRKILMGKKVSNEYLRSIMTPVWQKDFLKSKVSKLFND